MPAASRRFRSCVAAAAGLALMAVVGPVAEPSQAMTTRSCTQKGTSGNDTMSVTLTPGGTHVVCTGRGNDTVNIGGSWDNSTIFVLVVGTGSKTINLNADGDYAIADHLESALIRPIGATFNLGGTHSSGGFALACGLNSQYAAVTDQLELELQAFNTAEWSNGSVSNLCEF